MLGQKFFVHDYICPFDRYLRLIMFIGIDDTDSDRGLCTTYLAAVMMERLERVGEIKGLPRLIRLNPCARFKTRGNAAIAFELDTTKPDKAKELALQTFYEFSDLSGENTNPGLVVAEKISQNMKEFYSKTVTEILSISEARAILEKEDIWNCGLKNGRGLIGALAALGADMDDFTYELIVYRQRGHWNEPRQIDHQSVWKADALTYPKTWDTVDHHNKKIVFAPHSGDPILFGIRGNDIDDIHRAFKIIKSEPWERKVLYKTNQGTDAHIIERKIPEVVDDRSYKLRGFVANKPQIINGGHVFFSIQNGSSIECSAFEPTKNFRNVVRKLMPGDLVEVYGAVRDGTLNLEKIQVLSLAELELFRPPLCFSCGRRMESAGKNQGYRCRRCKTQSETKDHEIMHRDLDIGFYEVPPCARRHLSKPLVRIIGDCVYPSR
jgi:tRNA(Ile2)-agmatinylcytidine synthase